MIISCTRCGTILSGLIFREPLVNCGYSGLIIGNTICNSDCGFVVATVEKMGKMNYALCISIACGLVQ